MMRFSIKQKKQVESDTAVILGEAKFIQSPDRLARNELRKSMRLIRAALNRIDSVIDEVE